MPSLSDEAWKAIDDLFGMLDLDNSGYINKKEQSAAELQLWHVHRENDKQNSDEEPKASESAYCNKERRLFLEPLLAFWFPHLQTAKVQKCQN